MCWHSEGKAYFQEVFIETIHKFLKFYMFSDLYKLYIAFSKFL